MKLKYVVFLLFTSATLLAAQERDCEEVFSEIYKNRAWGLGEDGDPSSGWGSHYKYTLPYIEFLQEFLRENSVCNVVDLGCGSWEFSRYIDWSGVDYIGIDVSAEMISIVQDKFGTDNIQFAFGDILSIDLPDADLMVCKDVLQHLQNDDIALFLSRIKKYKHCLITNDIAINSENDIRIHKTNRENAKRGANRPIDLTLPPFNLEGSKVLTYSMGNHVKQVLYLHHCNP